MAGKPLNRLELRRQSEAAEDPDPIEDEPEELVEEVEDEDVPERKPKKKPKAATKAKPKSSRAAKPAARMRIVWTVMNDAYKAVGTFDYAQKEAAEARAAELTAKGRGTHFVQRTKEPMPEDAPGIGAKIPRNEVSPRKPPPSRPPRPSRTTRNWMRKKRTMWRSTTSRKTRRSEPISGIRSDHPLASCGHISHGRRLAT